MRALLGGVSGAAALACMACAPAMAQQAPALRSGPSQQSGASQQGGAPPQGEASPKPGARHSTHHASHRHHTRRAHLDADQASSIAPQPQPAASASAGTEPAPVPNEDALPPSHDVPPRGEVSGGSMSIHYPPTGEGFLPGSSSSDMDNRTTPGVPGVQYQEPLTNPAPQPLPPPDTANLPRP